MVVAVAVAVAVVMASKVHTRDSTEMKRQKIWSLHIMMIVKWSTRMSEKPENSWAMIRKTHSLLEKICVDFVMPTHVMVSFVFDR